MKKQTIGLIIGLVVQYLLGMATNMYVQFADAGTDPGDQFHIAWTHVLSAAHILVAFGLLFGSIGLIVRATRANQPTLKTATWIGFLAILVAGISGSTFVATQNDAYSFSMATAFIIALLAYGWGLYSLNEESVS